MLKTAACQVAGALAGLVYLGAIGLDGLGLRLDRIGLRIAELGKTENDNHNAAFVPNSELDRVLARAQRMTRRVG
jgi:hypothetical protein